MKKISFLFIVLIVSFLFIGCVGEKQSEICVPVYQIDLDHVSSAPEISTFLSDIKVRLMPLETKDSLYFNGEAAHVYVDDNSIFVLDASLQSIFRFTDKGAFVNKISRQGQGPEEYDVLFGIALSKGVLYGLDRKKIQLYDYDGNYLRTIPLKQEGRQIWVREDSAVLVTSNYRQPYQLTVYSPDGHILELLPSNAELLKLPISQSTNYSIGESDHGVYLTNYFDPKIYQFKDTVSVCINIDFGNKHIPDDFFTGDAKEIESRFTDYRMKDKAVFKIDNLTITDDWLIFTPALFYPLAVYYNRKSNQYIINKNLEEPFNLFFGKYNVPSGYCRKTGEFYRLVNAMELKGVVEKLRKQDPGYLDQYPFLKEMDVSGINENTNDWMIFFQL